MNNTDVTNLLLTVKKTSPKTSMDVGSGEGLGCKRTKSPEMTAEGAGTKSPEITAERAGGDNVGKRRRKCINYAALNKGIFTYVYSKHDITNDNCNDCRQYTYLIYPLVGDQSDKSPSEKRRRVKSHQLDEPGPSGINVSHDHDVSDVESDQPEVIDVHCPGCGEKVLDDDNFTRGCTIGIRHWWHRGCLPPEIQELSDDTEEAFPCTLCQNLLHRTCSVCMMEEYTHS